MHAQEMRRIGNSLRQLVDGQGAGVGGDQARLTLIDFGQHLEFQIQALRDGLDHQVQKTRQVGHRGSMLHTFRRMLGLFGCQLAALQTTRSGVFQGFIHAKAALRIGLKHIDLPARHREHIGDADTHGAATNDGHALRCALVHGLLLGLRVFLARTMANTMLAM